MIIIPITSCIVMVGSVMRHYTRMTKDGSKPRDCKKFSSLANRFQARPRETEFNNSLTVQLSNTY